LIRHLSSSSQSLLWFTIFTFPDHLYFDLPCWLLFAIVTLIQHLSFVRRSYFCHHLDFYSQSLLWFTIFTFVRHLYFDVQSVLFLAIFTFGKNSQN
jgi:cyanate permease